MMRNDIFEIMDYIENLEIPFNFASNGLAMSQEKLKKLATYKHLDMYFTSLLGVNEEKQKVITERDSYDKVMNAIEFFDDRGIDTYVQVTLANDFIDDMEEIVDKLMKFKKCTVKFTPICSMGIKSEEDVKKNNFILVPKCKWQSFIDKVALLQEKYSDRIEDCNIQNYDQMASSIDEY